jgi:hypothetical protein
MSDPISFFYRRDRGPAVTYAFVLTVNSVKDSFHFFVYSNARLPRHQTKGDTLKKSEQVQGVIEGLKTALEKTGGLFVVLSIVERKWAVRFCVSGKESTPRTFMEVEMGRPPRLRQMQDDWQEVPTGCRLVVPVDGESEGQLEVFRSNLSWLPEDLETVVLSALARPALDERVSQLEDRIFGKSNSLVMRKGWAGRKRRILSGLGDWWFFIRKPVFFGTLVVLTVMVFFRLSNYLGASGGGGNEELPAETIASEVAETATGDPAVDGSAQDEPVQDEQTGLENTSEKEFADDLGKVLEAVKKNGTRLPAFEGLYSKHFSAYAASHDRQVELASMLKGNGKDDLFLGLIKLQIVQLNQEAPEFEFLTRRGNIDETEKAAQRIAGGNRATDGPSQRMIATLACARWKEPQLGSTVFGPPNRTCDDYDIAKALPGLKTLPQLVNTFTPTPARKEEVKDVKNARNKGAEPEETAQPTPPESPAPVDSPEPSGTPIGGNQR